MESLDELEKRFYEELGVVPDVPAEILVNVKRRARASGVKRRIAVAACLLLALIIPTLLITQQMSASVAYADNGEAMDELLYAFEFMSGSTPTSCSTAWTPSTTPTTAASRPRRRPSYYPRIS